MPYYLFLKKGYLVDIVSIGGGKVPIDPLSVGHPYNRTSPIKRFIDDGTQQTPFPLRAKQYSFSRSQACLRNMLHSRCQ